MLPISSGTAGASDIEPFDYSQYANEDAGTPDFVVYHQKQLQSCGLHMGRDGYEVSDLHETPLYRVQLGGKRYSGGVDGGVVPYAVLPESAAKLLRIGFVHKQSSQDKATFHKNNPDVLQVRNPSVCASPPVADHLPMLLHCYVLGFCMQAEVGTPREYTFEEGQGQAVCCLLAAHAMCQPPLDLDVTDGKHHHLLRLRGHMLLVYEECTPKQVSQTCTVCLSSALQKFPDQLSLVACFVGCSFQYVCVCIWSTELCACCVTIFASQLCHEQIRNRCYFSSSA